MSDENVEVEVDAVEAVEVDQPTVSHDEYLELVSMRQSINGSFAKKETEETVVTVTDFIKRQIAAAKLARL